MVKKAAEATPNNLLQAARKERCWTQKEVADRIGAPQSFNISRWEKGVATPSAHYIQKLCLLFGMNARELGLIQNDAKSQSEIPVPPTVTPSSNRDSSSLWTVPYRRNPFFTGREEVLSHLHDTLMAAKAAALTQIQAISGLGGIGKTQIAVEYAYRYREAYHSVLWVRAASPNALISDFVTLASLLHLPEQDEQDQNILVAAVKRWLAYHKEWLLIMDNADDLELAADFLPTGDNGHILLTTRTEATGGIAPSITIEKMERDEGTLLLLRRAKVLTPSAPLEQASEKNRMQAELIAIEMDGLPLALNQAGAYIEETGCGLAGYLNLYHTHRKELLLRRSTLNTDHSEAVASTWALSFLKVQQADPAAADLLHLCAFLDPDSIPEEMITAGAVDLGSVLGPVVADAFKLNSTIEVLRKYSLLRRNPDTKTLTIHRLVQAVLKERMDEQTQRQWAERAVRAVNRAFPEVTFANWTNCQQYLPHVQCGVELIEQCNFAFLEASQLLEHAGRYLYGRVSYGQAESLLQRALTIREQVLGPEHPDTATILDPLALLYTVQSKYMQAEPLFKRALISREQVLGPEHPDTIAILHNLAYLYFHQNNYEQAEPLFKRVMTSREQVLGPDHPDTTDTLRNLAYLYLQRGQYEQAEPLLQRALAISEQLLGPEHPDTAIALDNLGQLYRIQGRYMQAEPLFQRALVVTEQVLGSEHTYTADILNDLGLLYRDQSRYAQAELTLRRALAIYKQAQDAENVYTANIIHNLARVYGDQGRYAQAEPLFQRALAIREQVLGPENPATANTLNHLARFYIEQGRYAQAEPLLQRALAIRERVLGPENHYTANSLHNLALLYRGQGKYAQAEPLLQRVQFIYEQTFGSEHPNIAESLNDLALLYHIQGQYTQAEPLYCHALAISERVLGADHPDTAIILNNLANLYGLQGHFKQAEPLYQRALAIRERALGPEHPRTATVLENLALLYQNQGHSEQAEPLYQRVLAINDDIKISGFN